MFGAFKKLVISQNLPLNSSNNKSQNSSNVNQQAMQLHLQKKFSKGIQYNMKILIKGDRNVGKTCLFERLQGKLFVEEYLPTPEIQVAHIQWNYKATDDVVKVEIWDVVDKGKKKQLSPTRNNLKIRNEISELIGDASFDAEFVDIYKGAHGIILMLDITKRWTLEYVRKELPKIPDSLPILLLANHRDMGHHRTINNDEINSVIAEVEKARPPGSASIKFTECSMKNAFGLKYVHKFFSLPFLQLQRESILGQLETNANNIMILLDELDIYAQSPDQDYEEFIQKSRSKDGKRTVPTPTTTFNPSYNNLVTPDQSIVSTTAINSGIPINHTKARTTPPNDFVSHQPPTNNVDVLLPNKAVSKNVVRLPDRTDLYHKTSPLNSIEEFAPKEYIDSSFLEDRADNKMPSRAQYNFGSHEIVKSKNDLSDHSGNDYTHNKINRDPSLSSDDEGANHNPMVMVYQDDLESDDEDVPQKSSPPLVQTLVSSPNDGRTMTIENPDYYNSTTQERTVTTPLSGNSDLLDSPPSSIFEILEPIKPGEGVSPLSDANESKSRHKSHKKSKKQSSSKSRSSHASHVEPASASDSISKKSSKHKSSSRSHKKHDDEYDEI